ncbi:MAG: DUF5683 domain-containing protein [candidate division WOR-3 bacterium]
MIKFLFLFLILTENKNPVKAAWMSAFLPGLGQVYTGNYIKGAFFFCGEVFLLRELLRDYPYIEKSQSALYRFSYNFILSFSLWAFNILDAYVSAHLYKFERDTSLMGINIKEEKFIFLIEKKF